MQSAHALAMNELNKTRENNITELERKRAEVRTAAPEYAKIESDLMKGGNALLRSVLHGGKDFEKIKNFIQEKQKKKVAILKSLNLPDDYLDEHYNCDICHDTGFDENGKKCSCLKTLTMKYIDINSNMTALMKKQTFENFDFSLFSPVPDINGKSSLDIAKTVYNSAKDFSDNFENGLNLMLKGNAGTGKTYISSCIANRALARGKTVYYQTSYKLCETLENVKFGKYENPDELSSAVSIIKYINSVDLLIIDDLGTEFITQFTAAALFDLINTRLINNKSTVISTNLDFDSMEKLYSSRFTSRILGDFKIMIITGGDLRKQLFEKR